MKTIKQIADGIGISKQRVERFFKKNSIQPHCRQGQAMQYDAAAETLAINHFAESKTATQGDTQTTPTTQHTALYEAVLRQLETKDKQIEFLLAENRELRQLALPAHKTGTQQKGRLRRAWGELFKLQKGCIYESRKTLL